MTAYAQFSTPMISLADRITDELQVLVGKPVSDCWRVANMQVFGFGPLHKYLNRKGVEVEGTDLRLHVQCRWRLVDAEGIIFGSNDLLRPADESVSLESFDWDKDASVLDVVQQMWLAERRAAPLDVVSASGDIYGGFRIGLARHVVLEAFPCGCDRGEPSEHWRLLGHRAGGHHFVVTTHGIE
jgi:hypothetical protein